MKKKFAAVFCSALALTSTLCFGGTALADEPLKIEFFQQKGEEGPQKGYKAIIEKFNEENPDIEIEMNTVPDAGTVLTSRISSGDIPVIFSDYPTQTQFKQKVANGYVQDLSDQDFLKNVNESSLEMTKQEDGGYYHFRTAATTLAFTTMYRCLRTTALRFRKHGKSLLQYVTSFRKQESHRLECMARIRHVSDIFSRQQLLHGHRTG